MGMVPVANLQVVYSPGTTQINMTAVQVETLLKLDRAEIFTEVNSKRSYEAMSGHQ